MSESIQNKDMIEINNKILRENKLWNVSNTENIVRWISTCNLKILLLNTYLKSLKQILRINTLWSLLISSITSTISVTQFTISDVTEPVLSLSIKIVIFITSVFTSLITGYIKVEKIQETIEIIEEHKNQWSNLMYSLLAEIQVPISLRKQADIILKEKREDFNNVNSKNINIPPNIREKVSKILVEKKYLEKTVNNPSWYILSNCCRINYIHSINVANTKRKLSHFISINKILEKEILSLLIYYPNEITHIIFDNENDMFKFKIQTEDFKVNKDKIENEKFTGTNLSVYTPSDKACKLFKKDGNIFSKTINNQRQSSYIPNNYNSFTIPASSSNIYHQPQNVVYIDRPVEKIIEVPVYINKSNDVTDKETESCYSDIISSSKGKSTTIKEELINKETDSCYSAISSSSEDAKSIV